MLNARAIPKVLKQALGESVQSVLLLNEDGISLGSVASEKLGAAPNYKNIAAICTHFYKGFSAHSETPFLAEKRNEMLVECAQGSVLIRPLVQGKAFLCLVGEIGGEPGLLRAEAAALAATLEPQMRSWAEAQG